MPLCLIVEDDPGQTEVLSGLLRSEGYEVAVASLGREAIAVAEAERPEIVLLDLGLPDIDGLEVIPRLLKTSPLSRVIVLTGTDSVPVAVAALRSGARHYLVKPWDQDELLVVLERERQSLDVAETELRDRRTDVYWGRCEAMRLLRAELSKLAPARRTTVLIEGETGCGKEVIAREIHALSGAPGPFVALNCAAVPSELMESELFGHERGSFTGATTRRRGVAELARRGTLFLDEIGEMPASLQTKLLRFLQDYRFRRVGGEAEVVSDCRVVAATHRDLASMQVSGAFRRDLYYRLAVVTLKVPPLRERRDDLLGLASNLLRSLSGELGLPLKQLSPAAESALVAHAWPGNVRELRNRLERALVLGDDEQIQPSSLDLQPAVALGSHGDEEERASIVAALAAAGGNLSKAAQALGVRRHWLRYRMTKHHIHRSKFG